MAIALQGAGIFTGSTFLDDHAVLIEGAKIIDILPTNQISRSVEKIALKGGILAPGFIDAQVNGGGGVLFNDQPTVEGIAAIIAAHRRFGTTGLLPTLITDREDIIHQAIAAVESAVRSIPGCLGLHLEGPHLAPARKGAHLAELMRPMQNADVKTLMKAKTGVLHVTTAVEQITPAQIKKLTKAGIIISLGHSDASFEESMNAMDAGAKGITHLFNAMSQMTPRAPGLVGAALHNPDVFCGIIADGHHVHADNLKLALKLKKAGKLFLVSDAMPTVGMMEGNSFSLHGRIIKRATGRLTLADGTLAGSDLDMAGAVRYCVQVLGLPVKESLRMASLYPAQFLGISTKRGRIKKGMIADLVHLNEKLEVTQTWVSGR